VRLYCDEATQWGIEPRALPSINFVGPFNFDGVDGGGVEL